MSVPAFADDALAQGWQQVWGRAPTAGERVYALAIANLETGFGRTGQFGALAAQGQYNWGALERARSADGTCPAGTVPGSDAGNSRCFFVYPSDAAAAAAFVHTLTKTHWPGVVPAMNGGTPTDVANAMKQAPAYFEAPASTYAAAIAGSLHSLGLAVPAASSAGSGLGWLLVLGVAGGAAWYVHRHGVQGTEHAVARLWQRTGAAARRLV